MNKYGLLGHPWRKEIYVFGNELIKKFKNLLDIYKGYY